MSDNEQLKQALNQAQTDSDAEIAINASAPKGCCTISAGGWSEQKSGITKEACNRQKGPGVKVTWKEGSC